MSAEFLLQYIVHTVQGMNTPLTTPYHHHDHHEVFTYEFNLGYWLTFKSLTM